MLRLLLSLAWLALWAFLQPAGAQTAVNLSPTPIQRFVDSNGVALSGGKLFVYQAGSTTKATTYTDSTGATPQVNPVILNARGEPQNNSGTSLGIWLPPNQSYKFVLAPSTDSDPPTNPIWTIDNVPAGATTAAMIVVSNNTALQALASTAASFFLRMSFATAGDAPPLAYRSTSGVCSVSSGNGDNGSQVKLADSNCAIAIFPASGIDAREFGLTTAANAAVSTPIAQAAVDAGHNLAAPQVVFPTSFNGNTIYVPIGLPVSCGGVDNPLYRKISGGALFVTVSKIGDQWYKYPGALTASARGLDIRDCFIDNGGLDGTGIVVTGQSWQLLNVGSINSGTSAAQGIGTSTGTTLTIYSNLLGATLTAAGSGYTAVGATSTITLAGGTAASGYTAVITIDSVDGSGGILTWHISNPGAYSVTAASLTQASSSSGGTGATFGSATWGVERGTISVGQMLICDGCLIANNKYPTIAGLGTGTGGPGTYTLSSSLSAGPRTMVTSSVWSFTDGAGAHTEPSAAITFLGSNEEGIFDGRYIGGYVGSNNWNGSGCLASSNIGLFMDSTTTDGGEKFNQNLVQGIYGPCNYIGIWLANGANNTIDGFDGQFDAVVILNGTGQANADSNHFKRPYCEGGSANLTWNCVIYGPQSQGSMTPDGLGSGSYVVQTVVNDSTFVTFDFDTYATYRGRARLDTFHEKVNYPTLPQARLTNSYFLNGEDGQATELATFSYGATIPYISGGAARGTNAVPAAVSGGDVLARHGGFMQYDTTTLLGHFGYGAYMDIRSGSSVSASNFNSYIVFGTVPSSATSPVDRWEIDTNGNLTALTALTMLPVAATGTNTAGINMTIAAGQGTGTGTGGSIVVQVAPAGGAGSSANALVTALTIDPSKLVTFAGVTAFASSSAGASTQTFTNSPCSGLTTERWIPVQITGQTGTWNIPACQ